MKFHLPTKISFVILAIIILAGVVFASVNYNKNSLSTNNHNQLPIKINTMQITSTAFGQQQTIPVKYTCDGEGINPPLEFKDVPQSAQTLALIVDDPDAAVGTWVHWLLWNISPSINQIAENQIPGAALVGKASSGQNNYGGPCPPSGEHRYFFKLYALDSKLSIPSYSESADLQKAMQGHIIGQAQLMGTYSRK